MHRFLAAMAVTLGRRAGLFGVVGLAVTILLGLGTTRLEFATGQDSYLNRDESIYTENVAYQSLFGGQAMLTVYTVPEGSTVVDLFTADNIDRLRGIEAELQGTEGIFATVTPLTALEFTEALVTSESGDPTHSVAGQILLRAREREPDPAAADLRLADAALTLERLNEIPPAQRTFENPDWVEFLLFDNRGEIRKSLRPFFPDERHAQLVVRLAGNMDIEGEGAAAEAIVEATDIEMDNAVSVTTGAPVLLKDINDYLKGGFLMLGGIAVVLMAIVITLLFNVRWRWLALGVVLVGLVWAFGLAGYLGIPLSVVTISGLPVLLGVGIDFGIQMHSRVEEEVVVDRELHPIQETTTRLVPPLLVATAAAVVSFLALQLARVPMIREFGWLLAVGIVVVVIAGVTIPTAVLGRREFRNRTATGDYTEGKISQAVVWLGSMPRKIVPALLAFSVVAFVAGAIIDPSLTLQTDPEEWVDQDSQVIQDLDEVRAETGSSSELGVFVRADEVFTDEVVGFVHDFAVTQLERHEGTLLTASSVVTTVSFLLELPGATPLPPTGEDVALAYAAAPEAIQRSTVADDASAMNIIFRTGPSSLEQRAEVVNDVRATVSPPPGISATPSGLAVVGVGLLENLESNRVLLTYVALAAVFVLLSVLLWSPIRAVLCLVPVLIAVGLSTLVAAASGIELSPITALGGPLVIAVCTEFASLILLRFREERQRGLGLQEASHVAGARTGRAFVASSLTTIIGVGVLATSSLPLLRDFGLIVSLNVAVALLSALVVLPPILLWADERGWVSGIRGDEARRLRDEPATAIPAR